jgi:hypothetical protein
MLASVNHQKEAAMSHLSHALAPVGGQLRAHRLIALGALVALMATTAVVLVLAIGANPSTDPSADRSQPALRADGGPEETGVAATIAPGPAVGAPDKSRVTADVTFPGLARKARAAGQPASGRPDESTVAAAISGH